MFTELHKEEKREEGEVTRRRRGGIKRREREPVIISLSVFHSLEHPKRFTEVGRGKKGEGGDRGDLGEKKECQKRREQSSR